MCMEGMEGGMEGKEDFVQRPNATHTHPITSQAHKRSPSALLFSFCAFLVCVQHAVLPFWQRTARHSKAERGKERYGTAPNRTKRRGRSKRQE